MADVAAVVVTYNAMPWLERCLESLAGVECVVVDHGSSDGSVEAARAGGARVVEQENLGLAAGWNRGLRETESRYVLILNADAWLVGDALERLVAFADAHPRAAVVGPRLRNPDGTLQRSVRGFPTLWRLATEYLFLRKLAPHSRALNGFYAGGFDHESVTEAEFVMGAALLVRREAVDEVGGADESFFLFSEEVDWCYRFEQAGWQVFFTPEAEVVHVGGAVPRRAPVRPAGARPHPLSRQAPRPRLRRARPEAARRLAAAARAALPRRARRDVQGGRALPRLRQRRGAPAMRARLGTVVGALVLLALARLLPASGIGLYLRLAAATGVVLLPGRLLVGAGMSATLGWSVGAVAAAMAVTFAVHGSLTLVLVLLGALTLALVVWSPRPAELPGKTPALVLVAGVIFGIALWHVLGPVQGDALFHLGRVRKLVDFGGLSLRSVDEFRDGGLHPGYAFPLWHGVLALVSRLADVDPALVVRYEATVLCPIAFVVGFEAGKALFRDSWLAVTALAGSLGLIVLAPGSGGALKSLALPATVALYVFVPAVLALFFSPPSRFGYATLAVLSLDLALIHPSYAPFLLVPLAGYLVARALLGGRKDVRCDRRFARRGRRSPPPGCSCGCCRSCARPRPRISPARARRAPATGSPGTRTS